MPVSVYRELESPKAPGRVKRWIVAPPGWLEVCLLTHRPDPTLLQAKLGPGERDAILLAQELHTDELIIDEMRGRREASRGNLHVIGTLGVLRYAAQEGLIDISQAIAELRMTNFRFTQELLDRLL